MRSVCLLAFLLDVAELLLEQFLSRSPFLLLSLLPTGHAVQLPLGTGTLEGTRDKHKKQ